MALSMWASRCDKNTSIDLPWKSGPRPDGLGMTGITVNMVIGGQFSKTLEGFLGVHRVQIHYAAALEGALNSAKPARRSSHAGQVPQP